MSSAPTYDQELSEIRSMLEPDGFALDVVDVADGELNLRLYTTTEDACEDCIVPETVMKRLIDAQLEPFGLKVGAIAYPTLH